MFRNQKVKIRFYELHQLLRKWLEEMLAESVQVGEIKCDNPEKIADLIFVIVDGAYYYLSMIDDEKTYKKHTLRYKQQSLLLLGLSK